jgi:hypothetical protein
VINLAKLQLIYKCRDDINAQYAKMEERMIAYLADQLHLPVEVVKRHWHKKETDE